MLAARSIPLNMSPVKTNRPLKNNNPAQNNIYCNGRFTPNTINKNANAAARSIAPSNFTIMLIFLDKEL